MYSWLHRQRRGFAAGLCVGVALSSAATAAAVHGRYFHPRNHDSIEMPRIMATCVYSVDRGGDRFSCGRDHQVQHPGSHFDLTITRRLVRLENLRTGRIYVIRDN